MPFLFSFIKRTGRWDGMRSREEGGTCKNPSQSDHSLSLASESTRQARRKNECTSYRCRYVRYKQALFCANLKERIVPKNMLVKSTLLITSNMVHCTETCKANSNSKCFVPTLVPSVLSPLKFQVFCPNSNSKWIPHNGTALLKRVENSVGKQKNQTKQVGLAYSLVSTPCE